MSILRRLTSCSPDFDRQLKELLALDEADDQKINQLVAEIVEDVALRGDEALLEYTRRFEQPECKDIPSLEIPQKALEEALNAISAEQRLAMLESARRIADYARHQRLEPFIFEDEDGTVLGQQITPLDRVGVYVPGGLAAYPSSVLMNVVPARVAGVGEIIMVVPAPNGEISPMVLAAASIAGVDRVFTIGGAQAVAALAYGTETIPEVDKIVGPGNIYVATAKRAVFGKVGIDMIAGPSEILVICDGLTPPDWVAMDLFAQAEHDELAQSILVTPSAIYMDQIDEAVERLLPEMERRDIIRTALTNRGAMILVQDLEEAATISNYIAPEHLELSVANPEALLPRIKHAGSIFMGRYTCEAVGDYCAGPNHVLPTSRTARFSSPLGVYDFQKRSSIINCSPAGAARLSRTAATFAYGEGLTAHARSAEYRTGKQHELKS
jgi:histidinol dehydrogenase